VIAAALVVALSAAVAAPASPGVLSGVVRDSSGGIVAGALVIVRPDPASGVAERQAVTGPDGRFTVDAPEAGDLTLIVRAGGFGEARQQIADGRREREVVIELHPATLLETVTVTPTRSEQRLGDVPAAVDVLTSEAIERSPALVADDILRQVPAFSLFRRTNSIAAQPTTQGVSLRGIGPSGQSRTLVLLDGVPFNDPFGGWVYWSRVPLVSVDRIEITEGTSSSLYGNMAMGGVINIITSRPSPRTIEVKPQYGNRTSPKVEFFASDQWNKVGVAAEGSFLNTDGFPIVAARERGPIDTSANVDYRNLTVKLEYVPTDRVQAFFRTGYFTEDRVNGKVGEVNDTRWTTASGGIRARLADESDLQVRVFSDVQRAHFNFLAVTNAATLRNIVRLATDQHVPTNGVGGMAQWTKSVGAKNVFSAGTDWRWVDGNSVEAAYVAAVPTVIQGVTQQAALSVARISGGTQQIAGAFAQDIFTPTSNLVLTVSARVDRWRNYDGHNLETTVATGAPTPNNRASIPERSDTRVSPHVGALYHLSDRVSAWGAVNSGFRAPTLTELYRQFSVGVVTTRPNDQLGPERLVGGEAGLNVVPARNVSARVTWFDNRVTDPVTNVTLTATLAQKQNLGRTRIRGVESDVEYRLGSAWRLSAGYIFDDATVTDGGVANAALVGKLVPQVPRHRGSLQLSYSNARIATVAVAMQFVGLQYNDDQNVNFIPAATLGDAGYDTTIGAGLPGYTVVDVSATREIAHNIQVFFGVQNLFDREYFVQTNPSTIGTPRLVNGGVRVRFSGR
jgi:outer membrane receptor protein involved in Fe transport